MSKKKTRQQVKTGVSLMVTSGSSLTTTVTTKAVPSVTYTAFNSEDPGPEPEPGQPGPGENNFVSPITQPVDYYAFFGFFPSVYRLFGFIASFLVIAFVIFHKITKYPDLSADLYFWEYFTLSLFIFGFLVRIASRKKREDLFLNRMRVNAFSRSTLFVLSVSCFGFDPLTLSAYLPNPFHLFMIQLIITFQLFFWMDKYAVFKTFGDFCYRVIEVRTNVKFLIHAIIHFRASIKAIVKSFKHLGLFVISIPRRIWNGIKLLWADFLIDLRTIKNYLIEKKNWIKALPKRIYHFIIGK